MMSFLSGIHEVDVYLNLDALDNAGGSSLVDDTLGSSRYSKYL